MDVRAAAPHGILERGPQLAAGHPRHHQIVPERLQLEQPPVRDRARRQVRPDSAVVHDGDVGMGHGTLGIGEKVAERVLAVMARPHEGIGQHRDGSGSKRVGARLEARHQRQFGAIGCHLIRPGVTHFGVPGKPAVALHQVHHAERRATAPRLHNGYPVNGDVVHPVRVAGDDRVHRSARELPRQVHDLAAAANRIAHCASMRDDDDQVGMLCVHGVQHAGQRCRSARERQPLHVFGPHDALGDVGDVTDHCHVERIDVQHGPGPSPCGTAAHGGVVHIGQEPGIAGLAHARA